jgi:hypothetical protein
LDSSALLRSSEVANKIESECIKLAENIQSKVLNAENILRSLEDADRVNESCANTIRNCATIAKNGKRRDILDKLLKSDLVQKLFRFHMSACVGTRFEELLKENKEKVGISF